MNRIPRHIAAALILSIIVSLAGREVVYSQAPADTQFQIYIDPPAHLRFGLYYPVTYIFQIPGGSSGLSAQYRFNEADPWSALTEYTAADFFNGVNAVRFDYANNLAYLSVAFSLDTESIYVRILNGGTEVPLAYQGISLYYDNRHAAATVSLDDWDSGSVTEYNDASQILTSDHMHYTGAFITDNVNWSNAQTWIDTGYLEPASHSRTHPCDDDSYASTGYDYELSGSRDDILSNLSLPYPYVPVYIEPCGFTSPQVRQAIITGVYLADRGYPVPPTEDTFASWGSDGAYQRVLYSTDTFDWGWWDGSDPAGLLATANSNFDTAYNAGGIYHLVDHPWQQHWHSPDSTLAQHISYVSNRLDVWYAALGELYLYHFVQERGLVTVTSVEATLSLNPGWNLIALPLQPTTPFTAESMLNDIIAEGGDCGEVDHWYNSSWEAFELGFPFNNFAVSLGQGYFTRCNIQSSWPIHGLALASGWTLSLQPGWNLVGVPFPSSGYTAQSLLTAIENQGGSCSEIDMWYNSSWSAHINGLPFNDFDILPYQGYFMMCSQTSTFTPNQVAINKVSSSIDTIQTALTYTDGSPLIEDIQVSNLRDASASITWRTDRPSTGWVEYGSTPELGFTAYDERGEGTVSTLHHVTITNLQPANTIHYRIHSGQQLSNEFTLTTLAASNLSTPWTVYGQIFESNNAPATGSLVFMQVIPPDGKATKPFSTLVDRWGYWALPLPINDCAGLQLQIRVQGQAGQTVSVTQPACESRPAPAINLPAPALYPLFLPWVGR